MLLSHSKKFLFVHIAKTGGTSVRSALSKYRWGHSYSLPQFLAGKLSAITSHHIGSKLPRHAKVIAAKEMLPTEYFDELFKFAFVRNPWDLQVSSYHHIRRVRPQVLGDMDFESFIHWKFDPELEYQYHTDIANQLQSEYLIGLDGQVLIDFIGHYETLQEDFNQICQRIGIAPFDLPHKRKATERKGYRKYYSDKTAQRVAEHFAKDIGMLGYSFD